MNKAVIVSACRTPIGKVPGKMTSLRDLDLLTECFKNVVERVNFNSKLIQYAFTGACLPSYRQNICRKTILDAGFSETIGSTTVNKLCASSMEALFQGVYKIIVGEADTVIVGGVESTSNSSYALGYLKENVIKRSTDNAMFLYDSFLHKFNENDMVVIAEKLARDYGITRDEIDEHAFNIYLKTINARDKGKFNDEIFPIKVEKLNQVIKEDEIRGKNISMELFKNKKSFSLNDGYFTQYNSAQTGDAAAAVILMSEDKAKAEGYEILTEVYGMGYVGVPFSEVGLSVVEVVKSLLNKYKLEIKNIDRLECNEAFAVQSIVYQRLLDIDPDKINANGSDISLGYPLGCTSLRACVSLLYELMREKLEFGIAAANAGGCMGQGIIFRNNIY